MKSQHYCVLLLVGFLGICIWSVLFSEKDNKPTDQVNLSSRTARGASDLTLSPDIRSPGFLAKSKGTSATSSEQLFEVAQIAHTTSDFLDGHCENMAITDALRLTGENPGSTNLDHLLGAYVSPPSAKIQNTEERLPKMFDRIAISFDGTIPEGASVKLAFRTLAYDEDGKGWDNWQEVPLKKQAQMISLGKLTERWQYRLVLSSKDIFSSPEIRSVSVSTAQSLKSAQEVAGIMEVYYAGKQAEAEAMKNPTLDR